MANKRVKIIPNYLPQFHEIPENNQWWGEGFTDWITVKNAKPFYENHVQPVEPLNDKYYDLSKIENIKWQAELAKEYGIYGFGIYHYWFSSEKQLLERPAELLLENRDIDIHYIFIWDNVSWRRTWKNAKFSNAWAPKYDKADKEDVGDGMLQAFDYGTEKDWEKHFMYLLPFFRDERYIKVDGKPVFFVFNQDNQPEVLMRMMKKWDLLAQEHGMMGMVFWGKQNTRHISYMSKDVLYEPIWQGWTRKLVLTKVCQKLWNYLPHQRKVPKQYNYDKIWKKIIKSAKKDTSEHTIWSAFVGYDDTPTRGVEGKVVKGAAPDKFKCYLEQMLRICAEKDKEYLFITAWNEWGEGAYLEPDKKNGYGNLEAVKAALDSCENL